MQRAAILVIAITMSACSDNSPTAPTPAIVVAPTQPPTATVQTVRVSLPALLVIGTPQQASATATLSNGSTQTASGSWTSSNPAIASVDGSGRVTPLQNGRVVIRVVTTNQTSGSMEVRVLPSYQGRWNGRFVTVGCSQSGFYLQVNQCREWPRSGTWGATLVLTQASELVSGTFLLGQLQSGTFTAPIESDGALSMSARIVSPPTGGISISGAWRVNSLTAGSMVGGMNQLWFNVGEFAGTGDMRIAGEILTMARQ